MCLKNNQGEWQEDSQLDNHIVDYFQTMFIANPEKGFIDFLQAMVRQVTESMYANLSQEFMVEEINVALKQMHLTKALGPDGMPPLFFQRHWHIVGSTIMEALLNALNLGQIPHDLN